MTYTIYRRVTISNPQSRHTDCVVLVPVSSHIGMTEETVETLTNYFKKKEPSLVLRQDEKILLPNLIAKAREFKAEEQKAREEAAAKQQAILDKIFDPSLTSED